MAKIKENTRVVAELRQPASQPPAAERRPAAFGAAVAAAESPRRWAKGLFWRARLGIIIPQLDHLTEPLLAELLPAGVSFHVARMRRTGPVTADSLKEMNRQFQTALELLPLPFLDIVIYHCTMGSLFYDPARLVADIEERTKLPGIATLQAAMDALTHFKAKRIVLVTPYSKAFNQLEADFLERHGFTVTAVGGENFEDSGMMQHLSPDEISLWVRRTPHRDCDGVFISCTGIRSLEFIDELEADLGVPVVTSTTAMLWQMIRKLGLRETIAGLGGLLR